MLCVLFVAVFCDLSLLVLPFFGVLDQHFIHCIVRRCSERLSLAFRTVQGWTGMRAAKKRGPRWVHLALVRRGSRPWTGTITQDRWDEDTPKAHLRWLVCSGCRHQYEEHDTDAAFVNVLDVKHLVAEKRRCIPANRASAVRPALEPCRLR